MTGIVGFLAVSIFAISVGIVIIRRQVHKIQYDNRITQPCEIPDDVWERLKKPQTAADMIEEATRHDYKPQRSRQIRY